MKPSTNLSNTFWPAALVSSLLLITPAFANAADGVSENDSLNHKSKPLSAIENLCLQIEKDNSGGTLNAESEQNIQTCTEKVHRSISLSLGN
jgi:hypothetical protein